MAGLVAGATPALLADGTNQPPKTFHANPEARAENQKILEIVGLTRADLKGLAPADRREKVKAAVQAKLAEFKQKQADGAITPQEKSDFALLQKHARKGGKPGVGNTAKSPDAPPPQNAQ